MDNNDKIKRSIIENVFVILVMSLYIVYGIHYAPLLIMFIPVPFVVIGIRNGISNNIISMAVTSLIVGLVLDMPSAVMLLLMFAPLSIALNYSMKKRKRSSEIIIISTIALFLSLLITVALGNSFIELSGVDGSQQILTETIAATADALKEMGMSNSQIRENIEILESAYEYMLIILPSILVMISLFVAYLNHLFGTIILRKMGYGVVNPPKFSKFKLPNDVIIGTGFMFVIAIIMGKMNIPYHNALLLNISFLVAFVFFLQGLSVLDFLLIKSKVRLGFRILILFINTVILPVGGILFFIGMFDSIFDIRKIGRRKSL